MKTAKPVLLLSVLLLGLHAAQRLTRAAEPASADPASAKSASAEQAWQIDGVERRARVYAPATAKDHPSPLVFVFHGHGGSGEAAAKQFRIHELWPEAICVYPNGLPTTGITDPEGKKPGWQHAVDDLGGRDLKFFDAMLASLRQTYKVDDRQVFATGFSNGSGFTFILWAARSDVLAAVAPCAGGSRRWAEAVKPKPVLVVAGEKDPLVKFDEQKAAIEILKKANGCSAAAEPFGTDGAQVFKGRDGLVVATYLHPGGHVIPKPVGPLVTRFFQTFGSPAGATTREKTTKDAAAGAAADDEAKSSNAEKSTPARSAGQ